MLKTTLTKETTNENSINAVINISKVNTATNKQLNKKNNTESMKLITFNVCSKIQDAINANSELMSKALIDLVSLKQANTSNKPDIVEPNEVSELNNLQKTQHLTKADSNHNFADEKTPKLRLAALEYINSSIFHNGVLYTFTKKSNTPYKNQQDNEYSKFMGKTYNNLEFDKKMDIFDKKTLKSGKNVDKYRKNVVSTILATVLPSSEMTLGKSNKNLTKYVKIKGSLTKHNIVNAKPNLFTGYTSYQISQKTATQCVVDKEISSFMDNLAYKSAEKANSMKANNNTVNINTLSIKSSIKSSMDTKIDTKQIAETITKKRIIEDTKKLNLIAEEAKAQTKIVVQLEITDKAGVNIKGASTNKNTTIILTQKPLPTQE